MSHSTMLKRINAVWSLYYRQWKFWAVLSFVSCYFLLSVIAGDDKKIQNAQPDQIPYEISYPLRNQLSRSGADLSKRMITGVDIEELQQFNPMRLRQFSGVVIVDPTRFNELDWNKVRAILTTSENIKTVYINPGVNSSIGLTDRDDALAMMRYCFDLQQSNDFARTIEPLIVIRLVKGMVFIVVWIFGAACMYFCRIVSAPLSSPVCRMMPRMIWPHIAVPGLFHLLWYGYVAFTFYQPWFHLGSYLTLLLSPFNCLILYLFYVRKKRPQGIYSIQNLFSLFCTFTFLPLFVMSLFKKGLWVSAFMLGYLPWVSEVALTVSLVLFCCLIWFVLQLCKSKSFSKSFEEMISESNEQKVEPDTKSETRSDQILIQKIKLLNSISTYKNRAGLLRASEGRRAISLIGAVVALLCLLAGLVFGIGFEVLKNEQAVKTLSFIFKTMLVAGVGLVFSYLVRNQSRLGTMPCYTLLPITKTEVRKVIFRSKAGDLLFWVSLFTLGLIALCLWSQNLKIHTLAFFLSAELAILGICIVTFAISIWKTMIGDYFDGKARIIVYTFALFWTLFPMFLAVEHNWDFSSYQLHLTIGLELFIPGVFLIWRAWSLWPEWEWGYLLETNGLFD